MSKERARSLAQELFASPCVFVAGAPELDSLPAASLPEIAFVGRSNSGKSSLVNAIVNRRDLARVSNTPGRTRAINLFRLGDRLMLADLPGYGYARASKAIAAQWQQLVVGYLSNRPSLRRVLVLIDARRGLMDVDHAVMAFLDEAAVSFSIVLTKIDQLKTAEVAEAERLAKAQAMKLKAAFPEVVATSAAKRIGLEALREQLAALIAR